MTTTKKKAGLGITAVLLATGLVANFEGTFLRTYADPVGIPTVCMGETDKELTMRDRFTLQECTALLGASLTLHAIEVAKCVEKPLKDHEAAALLSFSYNVGVDAACASTLMKELNRGAPPEMWCGQMKRWVFAGGKKLRGLEKRRDAEYKMCVTGSWK